MPVEFWGYLFDSSVFSLLAAVLFSPLALVGQFCTWRTGHIVEDCGLKATPEPGHGGGLRCPRLWTGVQSPAGRGKPVAVGDISTLAGKIERGQDL